VKIEVKGLYTSFSVLDGLGGDSVKSSSSLVGDDSGIDLESVSLLVFFNIFLFLELLETPSDHLSAGVVVGLGCAVSSFQSSVDVGEESDSGVWSQVDLAGERGDSGVDPVLVDGGEFVPWVSEWLLVASLTISAQAGRSTRLFFLRYWAKAWINSWAERSFTVKKVCTDSPSICGQ
jgi:hypothetical protein